MNPDVTLEDVVQHLDVTPDAGDGEASVLSRLENVISGEEPQEEKAEVEETVDTEGPTTEEEAEEPTDAADEEDSEETADEDGDKETEEEDVADGDAETLELSEEQLSELLSLSGDGVKLTDDGEVTLKAKVDGKEEYVPLKDLVASYQLEKHLRNKSTADAEARREFNEFKQMETQKLQGAVTDATALVAQLEQEFMGTVASVNMDELRQTNPAEWAAKNQEFQAHAAKIQQAKERLRGTLEAQQQEQSEAAQKMKEQYITEQTEKLLEKVPAWMDEKVAAKEIGEMQDAVAEVYGFTKEEIANINDHRVILMLRDAVRGRVVSDSEPVKKRLKKVPKIVKSSGKKVANDSSKKKVTMAKRNRARATGSLRDVASVLEDII